jgi:CBS domain-containing protein
MGPPPIGGTVVGELEQLPDTRRTVMQSSETTIADVMTHPVAAVGQDAPFKEIVLTMNRRKVSALPVLAGDGRVVGIVSEADLLPKEEFRREDLDSFDEARRRDVAKAAGVTAGDVMTAPAVCVHRHTTVSQAARIMALRDVKRLPVIDADDRLVGIASRGDLLKVFLRTDAEIAADVHRTVVDVLFPNEPDVEDVVSSGRVLLRGTVLEPALIPLATRLARAVEGVVEVRNTLSAADAASAV